MPVVHGGHTLLGGALGSFEDARCARDAALFLLPPLPGEDETLNSGAIRKAVAARVAADGADGDGGGAAGEELASTLAKHGIPAAAAERVLRAAVVGDAAVGALWDAAVARGEWVAGAGCEEADVL